MKDNSDTLFFTACTEARDFYAVPYAYFCLRNNPTAKVEVAFEDYEAFLRKNAVSIQKLFDIYPSSVTFRQAELMPDSKIRPDSVRFLEKPIARAKYLYIGDIDLLVLEDVEKVNLDLMERNAIPFSNILRLDRAGASTKRLSGFHFIRFDDYYPIPDLSDVNLQEANEEAVIYEIMSRKGLMVPPNFRSRPECGVQVSLSKDPAGRSSGPSAVPFSKRPASGWTGKQYFAKVIKQIREKNFALLAPYLQLEMKILLIALEGLCADRLRTLHRMSLNYCIDKRLLVGESERTRAEFLNAELKSTSTTDSNLASGRQYGSLIIWPDDSSTLIRHAEDRARRAEFPEAVELLHHISELKEGVRVIRESGLIERYRRDFLSIGSSGIHLVEKLLDPSAPIVLVAGLQRSGTNYVSEVLRGSFDAIRVIETGSREFFWKHAFPQESGKNVSRNFKSPEDAIESVPKLHVVIVCKHPLNWIASISVRNKADLRYQRPNLFDNKGDVDPALALSFYVKFHEEWRLLTRSGRLIFVGYENALFDATAMCKEVAGMFKFTPPRAAYVPKTVPYSKGDYESREALYKVVGAGLSDCTRREIESQIADVAPRLAFLNFGSTLI